MYQIYLIQCNSHYKSISTLDDIFYDAYFKLENAEMVRISKIGNNLNGRDWQ